MQDEKISLEEYLKGEDAALSTAIIAIAAVGARLSRRIALGALGGALGEAVGVNTDGDGQKALDIIADDAFAESLTTAGVRWFASEERESVVELDPKGGFAVAIDPLDGSSNIDVNVSIGTIFSVFDAKEDANASVLRPGDEQRAAGYIIYGPHTALVMTLGAGVVKFVLDRAAGIFRLVDANVKVAEKASEFAINSSNYRHWPRHIRAYIDDCLAGADGPRGKNFNMRWVASLVAETHRIVTRGGVFLYPADARKGYERGRLRHVYECSPIAMVVEQAGGRATNGSERILSLVPNELHARTPFVFGTAEKVARVAAYHDLPASEVAPLFGNRGLWTCDGDF